MIWKILGLVGAGSFIVNGLAVIADPNCITANFGGQSRIVTITCYPDNGGALPATTVGMLAIVFGLGILVLIFWRNLKNLLSNSQISATPSSQRSLSRSNPKGKVCNYCKREIPLETADCPNCFPLLINSGSLSDSSDTFPIEKLCKYCKKRYLIELKDCPSCFPVIINLKVIDEKVVKEIIKSSPTTLPKNIEESSHQSISEYKTCPMCAEQIKFAAKKCRYCQNMLDA